MELILLEIEVFILSHKCNGSLTLSYRTQSNIQYPIHQCRKLQSRLSEKEMILYYEGLSGISLYYNICTFMFILLGLHPQNGSGDT